MPLARKLFRIPGRRTAFSAARQQCLSRRESAAAADPVRFGGRWRVIAVIDADSEGRQRSATIEIDVSADGLVFFREQQTIALADPLRRLWPFKPRCRLLFASPGGSECIVGATDLSAAWILGRTTDFDNGRIFEYADVLRGLGFDPKYLRLITRA